MSKPRRDAVAALLVLAVAAGCGRRPRLETLSLATPYEVVTLDPHARNALSNFTVLLHFYDTLVATDADLKIGPGLASRWDTPDPSTWVFHLRHGVRFHSGRPLTAADVVYSFRRLMEDRRLEMSSYLFYIDRVDAIDPLTVRVHTTGPLSVLLNRVRFVAIVPEGSAAKDLEGAVDGTGPFRLERWQKGESITMLRNREYWGARPAAERVELLLARSPEQALSDLLSGRCQFAQCNSKTAEATLGGRFRVWRHPNLFVKYVGFSFKETTSFASVSPNPFRVRRVREAFDLAIDRRRLVDGLPIAAVPATQPVPPVVVGFNPQIEPPRHDPERARALLREAGLGGGFQATLHARQILAPAAELLRDQVRAVGIELDVKVLPDNAFFDLMAERRAALYLSRFGCVSGDAADILGLAIHSPDPSRHFGLQNDGSYSNPDLDRLIEESGGVESPEQRLKTLQRIVSMIVEDHVWAPLYMDEDVYAAERGLAWRPRNDSYVLAAEVGLAPGSR